MAPENETRVREVARRSGRRGLVMAPRLRHRTVVNRHRRRHRSRTMRTATPRRTTFRVATVSSVARPRAGERPARDADPAAGDYVTVSLRRRKLGVAAVPVRANRPVHRDEKSDNRRSSSRQDVAIGAPRALRRRRAGRASAFAFTPAGRGERRGATSRADRPSTSSTGLRAPRDRHGGRQPSRISSSSSASGSTRICARAEISSPRAPAPANRRGVLAAVLNGAPRRPGRAGSARASANETTRHADEHRSRRRSIRPAFWHRGRGRVSPT